MPSSRWHVRLLPRRRERERERGRKKERDASARTAHKASITTSCLRRSSLQFACRRLHLHTVYYRASSSAGVTQPRTLVPHPPRDARGRMNGPEGYGAGGREGGRREEGRTRPYYKLRTNFTYTLATTIRMRPARAISFLSYPDAIIHIHVPPPPPSSPPLSLSLSLSRRPSSYPPLCALSPR
jgi:hypothetical protein